MEGKAGVVSGRDFGEKVLLPKVYGEVFVVEPPAIELAAEPSLFMDPGIPYLGFVLTPLTGAIPFGENPFAFAAA